jgi:hypothetical protein
MANTSAAVSAANTPNLFTVEYFAEKWVTPTATDRQKKIEILNFETTWFDIATVTTIASIALTVITGSIALAALAWLASNVRGALWEAIVLTGIDRRDAEADDLLARLHDPSGQTINAALREHLEIEDRNWDFRSCQFLNCPLWLVQVAIPAQQVAQPQGVSQNAVSAPQPAAGARGQARARADMLRGQQNVRAQQQQQQYHGDAVEPAVDGAGAAHGADAANDANAAGVGSGNNGHTGYTG